MPHNNTANARRSLRALAIISTGTKWGGCPLTRVRSLIRSNTVTLDETHRRSSSRLRWRSTRRIRPPARPHSRPWPGRSRATKGRAAVRRSRCRWPPCSRSQSSSGSRRKSSTTSEDDLRTVVDSCLGSGGPKFETLSFDEQKLRSCSRNRYK